MLSALSSVAVLGTRARRVYASVDINQHFKIRYERVPLCTNRKDAHPACQWPSS